MRKGLLDLADRSCSIGSFEEARGDRQGPRVLALRIGALLVAGCQHWQPVVGPPIRELYSNRTGRSEPARRRLPRALQVSERRACRRLSSQTDSLGPLCSLVQLHRLIHSDAKTVRGQIPRCFFLSAQEFSDRCVLERRAHEKSRVRNFSKIRPLCPVCSAAAVRQALLETLSRPGIAIFVQYFPILESNADSGHRTRTS